MTFGLLTPKSPAAGLVMSTLGCAQGAVNVYVTDSDATPQLFCALSVTTFAPFVSCNVALIFPF